MKVGWHLPCSVTTFSPARLLAAARAAEDAGFDSLWANEHIAVPMRIESRYPFSDDGTMHADPTSPYAEPLATLAFVAAATSRVQLGVSVMVAALRHPLLMAKTTATVDALSGGRLVVGLGAGWMREEFEALGVPFERRGRVFDEHLEILRDAWSAPVISHDGEVFAFGDVGVEPRPAQTGGPPLWIGAGPTKAALRRTVRFADAIHMVPRDPYSLAEVDSMRAALAAASEEAGRERPPSITLRARVRLTGFGEPGGWGVIAGDPAHVAETLARHAEAGVAHFVFDARDVGDDAMQRSIEPLAEALGAIGLCRGG